MLTQWLDSPCQELSLEPLNVQLGTTLSSQVSLIEYLLLLAFYHQADTTVRFPSLRAFFRPSKHLIPDEFKLYPSHTTIIIA